MAAVSRKKLRTPKEASDYLSKPEGTMANWRAQGYGPAYIHVGRSVRYDEADLDAFLEQNRVVPEEQA